MDVWLEEAAKRRREEGLKFGDTDDSITSNYILPCHRCRFAD
jgi:hypothetical protein